ncbi:twin-arginine translocation signal domain-containing protein, partial [bacterium]|nr:twin-arginine translocation signal domain-containing protein [bacterium]
MSPNRREFLKNSAALAAGAVALESGLLSAAAFTDGALQAGL